VIKKREKEIIYVSINLEYEALLSSSLPVSIA
jgi:hypothetical protein